MSIETYGLSSEQYAEFFENNLRTAVALYLQTFNALASANVDFKTIFRLYQETVYVTNDDCRRYQKANNPEAIKDNDLFGLTPSREELMEEIQSVNAKVEALVDYISKLVETTTDGLNGLVAVIDKD
jgi:TRAP-type uncharacterized transport system substrate-binding protein